MVGHVGALGVFRVLRPFIQNYIALQNMNPFRMKNKRIIKESKNNKRIIKE
jgi:hypothetical protein